jgi:erythronate-4-phosphate dehydrogenase
VSRFSSSFVEIQGIDLPLVPFLAANTAEIACRNLFAKSQNTFSFEKKCLQYKFSVNSMIIALDQAIAHWEDAFSEFGDLRPFPGKELKPENIRIAEALIVRTITPVNASLLDGSSVRFVAAASAGIDHIDQDYLSKRGIHFCYAPGCNADAASEYVIAALHAVASRKKWKLKDKSLAVIGVGNVGSRVAKKARILGMEVLLCDPPLRDLTGDSGYLNLDNVLEADILSFHVPLVSEGPYPTWHMIDGNVLDRLSPRQLLINCARGAVLDNLELKSALLEHKIGGAVLDVWEEEPRIDFDLLDLVDIGTPHIAGSGIGGKIRATEMIRDELCRFCGIPSRGSMLSCYPKPRIIRPEEASSDQAVISSVIDQAYDILTDDAKLRALKRIENGHAAESFHRLRSDYPLRPEFRHFVVDLTEQHKDLAETLTALGFKLNAQNGERVA